MARVHNEIKDLLLKGCIEWFRKERNNPTLSHDLYAMLLETGKYGKFITYNKFCSIMNNRIFELVEHTRNGKILKIRSDVFESRLNNRSIFALTNEKKGDYIDKLDKSEEENV